MESNSLVRQASSNDAAACLAIYRPYVEDTAITFETAVPSPNEMARRITDTRETHEWLVLERQDVVVGYAYARAFNPRAAYRWSVEVSIYIVAGEHRTGRGRERYGQLLSRLNERGYRRAFAGITQPNKASNRFHESFGFQQAGLFRSVGWKHGHWHDVAWLQLDLPGGEPDDPPPQII